jgi:hypothetical protein
MGRSWNADENAVEVVQKRGVVEILKQGIRKTRVGTRRGSRKAQIKTQAQILRGEKGSRRCGDAELLPESSVL